MSLVINVTTNHFTALLHQWNGCNWFFKPCISGSSLSLLRDFNFTTNIIRKMHSDRFVERNQISFITTMPQIISTSNHTKTGTESHPETSCTGLMTILPSTYVVEFLVNRREVEFDKLNKNAVGLKKILSRIPDEIYERKKFLETIKWVRK